MIAFSDQVDRVFFADVYPHVLKAFEEEEATKKLDDALVGKLRRMRRRRRRRGVRRSRRRRRRREREDAEDQEGGG